MSQASGLHGASPDATCTCPSGGGSLRHPCPAHPASVELAGVAAKLTFINGGPAMCGCQVEYSSGGGEYSDVIYVTLCAKHSGSAILDLVATNRIALTPEYEGQWHADLYLDREIPLAKVEGATPAEAVLALMSAERIDPEQESVEQAGGDERAEFERAFTVQEGIYFDDKRGEYRSMNLCAIEASDAQDLNLQLQGWQARAALAQPSPKSGDYSDQSWINAGCPPEQPEQAEAERPEVVARVVHSNPVVLGQCGPLNANDELMTVAQHAASVARWAEMFNRVEQQRDAALAEVERLRDSKGDPVGSLEKCMKVMYERDEHAKRLEAALARVAKLERQVPVATVAKVPDEGWNSLDFHRDLQDMQPGTKLYAAPVAQAQHSVPEGWMLVPVEPLLNMMSDKDHDTRITAERQLLSMLAAAPGNSVPQAWLDVQAERRRQVEAEGWTPEHDDQHSHGQMARAAACYALAGSSAPNDETAALLVSLAWPWDEQWWKPSTARRDLVKACALALAEIERLDRAAPGKEGV
ncbi:hypothetical protein CGU43_16470 [Pseudomonas aeruginosa]|nr:hypothetical protein CGU43_16470 [Pseudomonas aeruginosa]RUG94169.1 hypothetical protein IPC751_06985 [Pseudomonas aeruginosa]